MPVTNGGEDFQLHDNNEILEIDSPKEKVRGPYVVVSKVDGDERWAIVAMEWVDEQKKKKPCLGIRWFWENNGHPNSRGYATWFVIPSELEGSILSELCLTDQQSDCLDRFLTRKICGKDLQAEWQPC